MKLTVLIAVLSMMWLSSIHASELTVSGAYAREMPPGVKSSAVYLSIKNTSDDNITLVSVSSPHAARVMVHQNTRQDDMMRMRPLARLEIAAHSQFNFTPGGYHLMVMGLSQSPQAGSNLDIEFQFDGGQEINVTVPVLNNTGSNKYFSTHKSIDMKVQD